MIEETYGEEAAEAEWVTIPSVGIKAQWVRGIIYCYPEMSRRQAYRNMVWIL